MKLSSAVETDGILLANDLHEVVNNKSDHELVIKDDEFRRIFWDQQVSYKGIVYTFVKFLYYVRLLHAKQRRMAYNGTPFYPMVSKHHVDI